MAALVVGAAIVFATVGVVPAVAQRWPGNPWWTPEEPRASESGLHVNVWLSIGRPGRVMYRTVDGSARALEDYTPVNGEVVFDSPTGDDARIRVPILEDDLEEGYQEYFILEAWEDSEAALDRNTVRVYITDNDYIEASEEDAAVASESAPTSRPTAPQAMSPERTDASPLPTNAQPPAQLGTELASAELRPGPGFELPIRRDEGSPVGETHGRNSMGALASGLGAASLGLGGVAWMHRRRRWSAHRA